jgi:hypothetical protein
MSVILKPQRLMCFQLFVKFSFILCQARIEMSPSLTE